MAAEERSIRALALTAMLEKLLDEDGAPAVSEEFKDELSALVVRLRAGVEAGRAQLHVVEDDGAIGDEHAIG
jgi:hypothetical protein